MPECRNIFVEVWPLRVYTSSNEAEYAIVKQRYVENQKPGIERLERLLTWIFGVGHRFVCERQQLHEPTQFSTAKTHLLSLSLFMLNYVQET